MSAAGPQKRNNGNWPSEPCNSSRNCAGFVWMSGTLRPSAGYIGRGVTLMSAVEYMLNHQNRLAQVKPGSVARARSQTFAACTRGFDCFQNLTSQSSREYQPLPTMPCVSGYWP